MKLRWKKEPRETGLRAIGAGPQGYIYHNGEEEFIHLKPIGGNYARPLVGWYWYSFNKSIPYKNTNENPCKTLEEAKKEASEYVQKNLK